MTPRWVSVAPWLIALTGLAIPLVAGGGAGWPYVVGWLVVLGLLATIQPLTGTNRQERSRWALILTFLLVVPGFALGGLYLVPAALVWLALEVGSGHRLWSRGEADSAPDTPDQTEGMK